VPPDGITERAQVSLKQRLAIKNIGRQASFYLGASGRGPVLEEKPKDHLGGHWDREKYERTCQPPDRNLHDSALIEVTQ
jgi:hypothetical protein